MRSRCRLRVQDDMNENDALYPIALFVVHHQFLGRRQYPPSPYFAIVADERFGFAPNPALHPICGSCEYKSPVSSASDSKDHGMCRVAATKPLLSGSESRGSDAR